MTVVALIDGPLPETQAFCALHPQAGQSPAAQHAGAIARAIRHNAPAARIDSYAVFPGALTCSVRADCDALHHAAQSEAQVNNCSFGIPRDAPELTEAVARVFARGKYIVASAPARGGAVYPAMHDGVIAVQGDARCTPGTWSWLGLPHALFGACAGSDGAIRGASLAAAHFTGHLARAIAEGREADMQRAAAFHGRERILTKAGPAQAGPDTQGS